MPLRNAILPVFLLSLLLGSTPAREQFTQQGGKLVGSGASASAGQGGSVALSADGNTAIEGGRNLFNTGLPGALWVFTRSNGVWAPEGPKLVVSGMQDPSLGVSVALSADGRTPTSTTAVVSMTPNRGTGLGPTPFTFPWFDILGFADLGVEDILVNSSRNGLHDCHIAYSRPFNTLYLVDDNCDALLPGQSLAAAGSTSNSQCTVSWSANPANPAGNNLALTFNIAFTAAFSGNRIAFVAARGISKANSTGWHAMATWTPQ